MKDLGYTEVDCVVVDLEESKEKALNIALNKISGEWDTNLLANLLRDLDGSGFDITLTGSEKRSSRRLRRAICGYSVNTDCSAAIAPKKKMSVACWTIYRRILW